MLRDGYYLVRIIFTILMILVVLGVITYGGRRRRP